MASNSELKSLKDFEDWDDEMDFPQNLKEEVTIKHIEGPLFFGSTTDFQQLSAQIPDETSTIVLRMSRVPYIDQSGLYAIEDLVNSMESQGKTVLLVGVKEQPKYMMERIDIIPDLISEDHIFDTFTDCLKWIIVNVEDTHP